MHVALASIASAWEDKALSLERCHAAAVTVAAHGAQLVVFPETTLTGFSMHATSIAEPAADAPTIHAFAELARTQRVAVAFGVVLHGRARPTNSMVVLDPDGAEVARYAKVHPFSFAGEEAHYENGEGAAIARLDDVAFGLSICYDLRFPELYTAVAERVHALLVIANWPEPRIAHWQVLLQARAIENQCWVLGVNRTGEDGNGLRYPPSSYVFDPAGVLVLPEWAAGEVEGYTISAERVREQRRAFPVLRDRRPDLYRVL